MASFPWKRSFVIIVLWILNPTNIDSVIAAADDICYTKSCNETSDVLAFFMQQNVDPCDNFFEFACGGYVKNKVIPEGASDITIFNEIYNDLQLRLRNVIEREIDYGSIRPFRLLKTYYDLCMDTDTIEKTSKDDLLDLIRSIGGWPLLDESWDEASFDWKKFIYKSKQLGYPVDSFIGFQVTVDPMDNRRNLIKISQPVLILPRGFLLEGLSEMTVRAFLNYSITIAEIFGAKHDKAKSDLEQSLEFVTKLANISVPSEELLNVSETYHIMNLQQLKTNYSDIPWEEYLNELLAPFAKVQDEERIWVEAPSYLEKFNKLIQNTPKRVIANYGVWRMVQESAFGMGEEVQTANRELKKVIQGVETKEKRWQSCMGKAVQDSTGWLGHFLIASGALYVKKYFNESLKVEVTRIIDDVRESFQNLLYEVKWMDEETRKVALKKLQSIKAFIGYPDGMLDNYELENYYKNLEFDSSSFLRSELSLLRFEYGQLVELLRKENSRDDWRKHGYSAIINALYLPSDNTIELTAGLLQGHLFAKDRPRYMNYGSVGWVIGHEMTHAFDTKGRQYDEVGNLKDWWSPETELKYYTLAANILKQYSTRWLTVKIKDQLTNLTINGYNTLGENIADIGGIEEAYRAYVMSEKKYGVESKLPNLPYNPRQLFWIGAATSHCVKVSGEGVKDIINNDEHAPSEIRVLVSFSNMVEFSKDFNCSENSKMNPKEKYSLWSSYKGTSKSTSIIGKQDLLLFALFLSLII